MSDRCEWEPEQVSTVDPGKTTPRISAEEKERLENKISAKIRRSRELDFSGLHYLKAV